MHLQTNGTGVFIRARTIIANGQNDNEASKKIINMTVELVKGDTDLRENNYEKNIHNDYTSVKMY